jgi:hypothetical protein
LRIQRIFAGLLAGNRYPTTEELIHQERQEKERLQAYLRSLGINPDSIGGKI